MKATKVESDRQQRERMNDGVEETEARLEAQG